ncbi:hypothetical protein FP364_07830 [Citrobacter amalonaticus]|nr:hypothetical protein [Citrobacter amalonaticus]
MTATIAASFFMIISPFDVISHPLNTVILNKFLRQKKSLFLLYITCNIAVYLPLSQRVQG